MGGRLQISIVLHIYVQCVCNVVGLYSGCLGACGCAGSASVCLSVYECICAKPKFVEVIGM